MTGSANATESLADRTARAARWRLSGSLFGAGSQFAIGVLLARLLAPADFGLVALAAVVLGFARTFNDLGIGNALVQRAAITTRHVRSAFTFSVLLGFGVAALIAVSAPVWAAALHDARVASVLRVLAIGFAVGGTSVVAG